MIKAEFDRTFEGWRKVARKYLLATVAPQEISWSNQNLDLFGGSCDVLPAQRKTTSLTVPKPFMKLAEAVAFSNDSGRWDLLYRILYRLQHENPHLLSIKVDDDIYRAEHLAKSVRRDIHKMHAFVRFKRDVIDGQEIYRAWHKPEHPCLRIGSPFFARRFGDKPWSIFTPDESAHWDLTQLTFGPGMAHHEFQSKDDWDEVWKTYYKSIFNPARIKIKMMKQEMAPKYWASMPETALINELVREAPARLQKMARDHQVAATVDPTLPLSELKKQAQNCQACPLYRNATQTVFGEGPTNAQIMIVGEQPGDQEDQSGLPFVGPAGEVLNAALAAAGIDRDAVYLTNAVKHFKWIPSSNGKTRIHKKPSGGEMSACKPWLMAEIVRINPKIIIALGATAATALLGRLPKITAERGKLLSVPSLSAPVILSWHPAAILRSPNPEMEAERRQQLTADLQLAHFTTQNFHK